MHYVIGIDGGGTKTLLKMAGIDGKLIACHECGPSNINSAERGAVREVLSKLIYEGVDKAGMRLDDCLCLCIGAAGAGREKDRKIIENIIRDTGFTGRLVVTDDIHTAFYGGVGGNEGIIAISGTGSVCFGKNSRGESHRAGGWGHIIGDEGSGYYIGREVLTAVIRSYDGRQGYTELTDLVLEHLNLKSPEDLVEYVYRSGAGKREISSLAAIAAKACALGDFAAEQILKNAAKELFHCAGVVIEKLGFMNKSTTMALGGSVLVKDAYVRNEFSRLIGEAYPNIGITVMKDDAAWGAVLIALEELGCAG